MKDVTETGKELVDQEGVSLLSAVSVDDFVAVKQYARMLREKQKKFMKQLSSNTEHIKALEVKLVFTDGASTVFKFGDVDDEEGQ